MPLPTTSVAVGDDSAPIRDALRALLAAEDDLRLVGTAPDAAALVELCGRVRPDVAVVDVEMPQGGGLAAVIGIARVSPTTEILVFSAHLDDPNRAALQAAGVEAFVDKAGDIDALVRAIRRLRRRNALRPDIGPAT